MVCLLIHAASDWSQVVAEAGTAGSHHSKEAKAAEAPTAIPRASRRESVRAARPQRPCLVGVVLFGFLRRRRAQRHPLSEAVQPGCAHGPSVSFTTRSTRAYSLPAKSFTDSIHNLLRRLEPLEGLFQMGGGGGRTQVHKTDVQFGQPAYYAVQSCKQALPLFGVFAVLRDRYCGDLHP